MNWTTENTLVLIGYLLLMGGLYTFAVVMQRRQRRQQQVELVRDRLTKSPALPRYKTVVQLDSNGSLMSFVSRVPLSVGTHVSVDIRGELAPTGTNSIVLGLVVSQEIEL